MGCSTSKQLVADDSAAALRRRNPRASMAPAGYKTEVAASGPEAQRQLASAGTVELPLPAAGLTLRYAFVSQRGYYPDAPDKSNQDAVCVAERLDGSAERHLFGVFDGHGELGTECAAFVRDRLAENVTSQPSWPAAPADALAAALVAANSQLHEAPIDDCLSGTTACCALLEGRTLHVANVGDSRAVLAEAGAPGEPPTARDLSQDQTPFRADECLRVLKAGARVMTLDQLEGLKDPSLPCWTNEADCDGDPPRLWSPAGLFPGTAFTRSIGDSAAEDIGVIADPEMTATQLEPRHPFAILASDGVWEFMTSQKAVEMVAKHDNPYDACKALVSQAYKLWLQKETRTDDISAVVLFFNWKAEGGSSGGAAGAGRNAAVAGGVAGAGEAGGAAAAAAQGTPAQGGEPPSRLGSSWRSRSGRRLDVGA